MSGQNPVNSKGSPVVNSEFVEQIPKQMYEQPRSQYQGNGPAYAQPQVYAYQPAPGYAGGQSQPLFVPSGTMAQGSMGGQVLMGQAPMGQGSMGGQVLMGQAPIGQGSMGWQAPMAQGSMGGQVLMGQAPMGQVPMGQAHMGQGSMGGQVPMGGYEQGVPVNIDRMGYNAVHPYGQAANAESVIMFLQPPSPRVTVEEPPWSSHNPFKCNQIFMRPESDQTSIIAPATASYSFMVRESAFSCRLLPVVVEAMYRPLLKENHPLSQYQGEMQQVCSFVHQSIILEVAKVLTT